MVSNPETPCYGDPNTELKFLKSISTYLKGLFLNINVYETIYNNYPAILTAVAAVKCIRFKKKWKVDVKLMRIYIN